MQKILIGLSLACLVLGTSACEKEKSCEETNTCPLADPVKFSTSRDSSVVSGRASSELNATVYVKNTDTKALNLKWKRINPNMPSTWELATCANADCYVPTVADKEFTLAVGDSMSYKHVFRPQSNAGVGTAEAIFYDPTDSARTVKKVFFKATAN
jgi:hypothetical protein